MKLAARLFLLALLGLSVSVSSLAAWPGGGRSLTVEDRIPIGFTNKAVSLFVRADLVVVGKVKAIEQGGLIAGAGSEMYKAVYRVAVVEVTENIHGARDRTEVRVGFRPTHNPIYKDRD